MKENDNIIFEDFRTQYQIDVACCSGIGARESQQDAAYVYAGDDLALGVICDGMGGARGGEIASSTAIRYVRERFRASLKENIDFVDGALQMLESVDDLIFDLKDRSGNRMGCGTTLVATLLSQERIYWFSVGDSRMYLQRGAEMIQVTADHNYYLRLRDQLRDGQITQTEYQRELPRGEALISFIGMGGLMLIDVNDSGLALRQNDTVLLCSDGVYRTVTDTEISELIRQDDLISAGEQLANLIEERMTLQQDNYTFVMFRKRK